MRKLGAVAIALLAGSALAVAALVLTGVVAVVTTHGTSMQPRLHAGDLVVVAPAATYAVGDSVAYHSEDLDTTVLHRIVAVEDGRYTFRGDNNSWLDPERPTEDLLIGKELLHIPGGGIWLDRLTSPIGPGLLAFVLLATGASAARTRRARRRRRTMSQHAARGRGGRPFAGLPRWATSTAAAAALVGALGAALAAFAWTGPTTRSVSGETSSDRTVTFSYLAQVPRTAAYDDTLVRSPEPVFRAVTDTVDLRYRYEGEPGSVRLTAELSTTSGWRSTLPLAGPTSFDDTVHDGGTTLDLPALEKRAQRAADVIGVPADQLNVVVKAHVRTEGGQAFVAELPMTLSATHLALVDPAALSVTDSSTTSTSSTVPRTLGLLGHEVDIATARTMSLALLILALLTAAGVGVLARTGLPESEGAVIRRRHANLLVRVEPVSAPTGRPVIDVSEFATLVKLAERYGLLVLHWSRSNVETFVVQDESITYRYRTAAGPAASDATESADAHSLLR